MMAKAISGWTRCCAPCTGAAWGVVCAARYTRAAAPEDLADAANAQMGINRRSVAS